MVRHAALIRNAVRVIGWCLLISTSASAANYYVDAARGDDSSGTGSQARPWRTVTHAMSKVNGPGDVLYIGPGSYDAALGEAAEINLKSGVTLIGSVPWVTNIRAKLVCDNLAQAPTVSNLLFSTFTARATAKTMGLNIYGCVLDEDVDKSLIVLDQGAVFNPQIAATRIQGRGVKLFQFTLTNGSKVGGAWTGCNTYLGMDGAHEVDVALSQGSEFATTFTGNLFHIKRREGLMFWIGYDVIAPRNVFSSVFVNNTFTLTAFHLMEGIDHRPMFYNNIIAKESGFWLLTADRCVQNCIVDGTFDGMNGNFAKAPMFVHEEKDFRLRHDSPCIDAGRDDAPGLGAADRDGIPRFLDGDLDSLAVVDMGSQEFSFGQLSVSGVPAPGGSITYHAEGNAPFGGLLFMGCSPGVVDLDRFGNLLLAPCSISRPVFMGWLPSDITFAIPNDARLSGATLYAQVLALMPCLCTGTLSNRVDLVIQ